MTERIKNIPDLSIYGCCPSYCETAVLIDKGEKQRNLQFIGKPLDYSRTPCYVNAVIHRSNEDDCLWFDISH